MLEKTKGIIVLVIASFCYATFGFFSRYLNGSFTLLQQVYLRIGVAGFLSLVVFYPSIHWGKLKQIRAKEWGLLATRSIAFYILNVLLVTQAYIITNLGNVGFILALPFIAVFGILFLKEKLTKMRGIFLGVSVIGVLFLTLKGTGSGMLFGSGEVLALFGTICLALSLIARRWHSALLNDAEITVLMFFISFICLVLLSLFHNEGIPLHWTGTAGIALVGVGIINVFVGFALNYGFSKVEAVIGNNILTLQSIFSLILGFAFYREIPSIGALFGGTAVLIGAIGINMQEGEKA